MSLGLKLLRLEMVLAVCWSQRVWWLRELSLDLAHRLHQFFLLFCKFLLFFALTFHKSICSLLLFLAFLFQSLLLLLLQLLLTIEILALEPLGCVMAVGLLAFLSLLRQALGLALASLGLIGLSLSGSQVRMERVDTLLRVFLRLVAWIFLHLRWGFFLSLGLEGGGN